MARGIFETRNTLIMVAAAPRPCAECRRARYNEFREAWSQANQQPEGSVIRAPQLDAVLHKERIDVGEKVVWREQLGKLPLGAMFQDGEDTFSVHDSGLLEWGSEGYRQAPEREPEEVVEVLTPKCVIKMFKAGFRPEFHSSAES